MSHGKDAARDLRYGRRGGAWKADEIDGAPKAKAGFEEQRCPVCRLMYRYNPDKGDRHWTRRMPERLATRKPRSR